MARPLHESLDWAESFGHCHHRYTDLDAPHGSAARRAWRRGVALAVIIGTAVGWMVGTTVSRSEGSVATLEPPADSLARDVLKERFPQMDVVESVRESMGVQVWNDYMLISTRSEHQLDLYPWVYVAEPGRMTVMELTNWPKELMEDFTFKWLVNDVLLGTGYSVKGTFDKPGAYKCSVTAYFDENKQDASDTFGNPESDTDFTRPPLIELHRHEFDLTVKYVRREIRDLTDRDRETFFNAMAVMQRVPSAVGRQIYGHKYYSKDYFNRMHLYYGGARDCDHWHDGAGFVTSHIAVSLMFEQSLQAVNPSIALPYWDFTIEGMEYDWTNFRDSGVFSDDWFGEAAPRNEFMTPDRGRFAYVPVMANATEYSDVYNAFGLLRAPWNSDPNPFLTRHDHVFGYVNNRKPAGCKQYRDAVRKDNWMALTESMNAGAHGHIHELLGGAWAAEWHGFFNRTEDIILPFTHIAVPLMKYLWRSAYIECPETCGMELAWEDCQCYVNDHAMIGKRPSEILEGSGVLSGDAGAFFYDKNLTLIDSFVDEAGHAHEKLPGYTTDETHDIFTEMLRVLSTPMKIGSHYEGTSTNDATFWVLHPTFDRLWHLSRLQTVANFNNDWVDDHTCYGHNPTDIQPFHDLFLDLKEEGQGDNEIDDDNASSGDSVMPVKKYYTNEMLYELLRPDGMASTYVYDHFVWSHCDAVGIFMRGLDPDE